MILSRRNWWFGAVAFSAAWGLAGCSSEQGDWGQVLNIVEAAFGPGGGVTMQQAAAIPFATLGVRVGDSTEDILVLAGTTNGQRLWTNASHVVLQTRDGRILRTAGLPHNRTDIRLLRGDGGPPPLQGSAETTWEEDFGDLHKYSIVVSCHSTVKGSEGVKNFTSVIPTTRVDEDCRSDQLDWSFTNSYWISPKDGLAWKSIQYISPKLDPVTIELLRPPSK